MLQWIWFLATIFLVAATSSFIEPVYRLLSICSAEKITLKDIYTEKLHTNL